MEYRVLGPIEVMLHGQPLVTGGYRQRLVLALLLSRANSPVGIDWLVTAVWGDSPPRTARRTLQVYLVRLRQLLGAEAITTIPDGYTLHAVPDEVDWMQFERLARRGDRLVRADPVAAAATLREALALWRGRPYGDLGEVVALAPEVGRLDELRLATVERRVDADLTSGQSIGLVAELDELVAEHPLRERLRGQLMLALYRSERQAEALGVYEDARAVLDEELGIRPSVELRELHARILRQDPTLEPSRPEEEGGPPAAPDLHARVAGRTSPDLPSGLVTFVMTDIEGSTRLFRRFPDAYPSMLRRHQQILVQAWVAHAGTMVEADGDGTLASFADAAEALRACTEAQAALAAETWPGQAELRVRMGVHTGLAIPKDGDYIALAVHQTARVADAAHGGQVLVSTASTAAAQGQSGFQLTPLGRYRLRDFDKPEALSQLTVPRSGTGFPPVRALPAEGHNLSLPHTSFVDRETERAFLADHLSPGGLLTVVGPGGVGKSRLASEVGVQLADGWPDGVWRVSVDTLGDSNRLVASIAESIGMTLTRQDAAEQLVAWLQESGALLVLDGCERHLGHVASLVETLRQRTTRSAVLATSREPLHLSGEVVLRLRPLSTDRPGLNSSGEPEVAPAVQLFVDRAQAADSAFALTPDNQPAVLEVVRRLDGLPLAEEIAAARTAAFSPAELLESIDRGIKVLKSPNPSLPERQRTIENLLRWSEDLLSEPERVTLRRLAVFAGPFTLAAARVAGADGEVDDDDLPDNLWALVDQSLITADPSAGGTRYRMLDLVRRYAEARLVDSGEAETTAMRVGQMYQAGMGPTQASTQARISEIGAELDSIRGVVSTLAASSNPSATELAGQLAITVVRYLEARQSYRTGIDEAQSWLQTLPDTAASVPLLSALAMLHLRLNEVAEAETLALRAQQVQEDLGAPVWAAFTVERALGEVANRSGRPLQAAAIAEDALSRAPDARSRARLFNLLGIAKVQLGDVDGAAEAFDGELAACAELGDDVLTTWALANAAELALRQGRQADAAAHQRACLRMATALGQPVYVAYSAIVAARLHAAEDPATATRLIVKARDVLADSQHELYPDDAAEVEQVLSGSADALGDEEYRRRQHDGHSMGLDELAQAADGLLQRSVAA